MTDKTERAGPMPNEPDMTVSAREVFNVDIDMQVPAFSATSEYVPDIDPN